MGLEEMVRMLRNQLSARQEEVDGSNVLPTPTVIKVKSINPSVAPEVLAPTRAHDASSSSSSNCH